MELLIETPDALIASIADAVIERVEYDFPPEELRLMRAGFIRDIGLNEPSEIEELHRFVLSDAFDFDRAEILGSEMFYRQEAFMIELAATEDMAASEIEVIGAADANSEKRGYAGSSPRSTPFSENQQGLDRGYSDIRPISKEETVTHYSPCLAPIGAEQVHGDRVGHSFGGQEVAGLRAGSQDLGIEAPVSDEGASPSRPVPNEAFPIETTESNDVEAEEPDADQDEETDAVDDEVSNDRDAEESNDDGLDDDDEESNDAPDENEEKGVENDLDPVQPLISVFDAEFFDCQIWYNAKPKGGRSRWRVKLRSGMIPDVTADDYDEWINYNAMDEFNAYMINGGVEFRKSAKGYRKVERITKEFHDYVEAESHKTPFINMQMGLLSQPVYRKFEKRADGDTSRLVNYAEEIFVMLRIDKAINEPVRLTISQKGRDTIIIENFLTTAAMPTKTGKPRGKDAANWIRLYDPKGLHAAMVQSELDLEALRQSKSDLATYSPGSKLDALMHGVAQLHFEAGLKPVTSEVMHIYAKMEEMEKRHQAEREADRKQMLALIREMTELKNALT